jgi:hypothetical protein
LVAIVRKSCAPASEADGSTVTKLCVLSLLLAAAAGLAPFAGRDTGARAQPAPAERQAKSEPQPAQTCWHPGLARSIGIAEQSCDAPMTQGRRPVPGAPDAPDARPAPAPPNAD